MRMMIHRGAVLCLALALAACGDDDDDGFNPTMDDVAGSYTASAFTLTSGNGEFDLLALGANVTAVLNADGTTTGRLQVPGGVEGAGAIDQDLAGTWSLSGTTVTFTPSESSLLTDVDFAVGPNTLTGEGTYEGAVLLLVLTKDE
jgi:hypothetical protein